MPTSTLSDQRGSQRDTHTQHSESGHERGPSAAHAAATARGTVVQPGSRSRCAWVHLSSATLLSSSSGCSGLQIRF